MAGKHSVGGHARKKGGAGKIVMIVLIALVLIAALVLGLAGLLAARPQPVEELPGYEATETLPEDAPEEVRAPTEEEAPAQEPEELYAEEEPADMPEEIQAPEEEPTEGQLEEGPEVPGEEDPSVSAPRMEFGAIYEAAGLEPVYQLSGQDGLSYAVMARGDAMSGISQYEFLYDEEDRVVTMAETYYTVFAGASQSDLETVAQMMAEESMPPEDVTCATVTSEVAGEAVILKILMEGMDDPAVVSTLSEIAFIPYTAEEYLYFTPTRENLVDTIGYAER